MNNSDIQFLHAKFCNANEPLVSIKEKSDLDTIYLAEYHFLINIRNRLCHYPFFQLIVDSINDRLCMISAARNHPGAFQWLMDKKRPKKFLNEVRKDNTELADWLQAESTKK